MSAHEPLREPKELALRRRFGVKGELLLAALPTAMILFVLFLVETLSRQRLLFASLAMKDECCEFAGAFGCVCSSPMGTTLSCSNRFMWAR